MMSKKRITAFVLSAILMLSAISFSSFTAAAAESVLTKGTWYESMYIEWNGVSGTDYNVYSKERAMYITARALHLL